MAVSARDLYFAVRVEDRATRPLRRIAADFRALGKAGLAQRVAAAEQANIAERTARSRLKSVSAQIQSVKEQRTATAEAARTAAQELRVTRAKLQQSGVAKSMRELDRSRITNATKLSQIETAIAQRRGAAGQKYEKVLANAATVQPAALARARRGILMSGLNMAQLEEAQQSLLMQTANLNLEETRLAERAGVAAGALSKQAAATAQLSAADAKLAAEEALLNEEFATASLRHSETIRRQNLANKSVREFPIERLQGAGRIISHLGRVLATFGGIGAASFGFLGVAAANFGKQVTLAATQSTTLAHNSVMQVQKNAAFIKAEIQKILASGRVIAQPEEQTAATYRIFSGITLKGNQISQLKQGITLLKEFNRVTTANMGLVSLEEVTRAGITLINRFGYTAANIRDPLNTMQAAVRFGDITLSEFIASMNQAAPAAQAAGYSFKDMAVGIAFASRQFSQVRMGSTGYARLVETFSKRDTIDGLKAQGVAITTLAGGFEHLLPIQEIARRVIAKFGGDVKKGTVFVQNFFKEIGNTQGTIQARRYLEALLHRLPLFNTIFKQVTRDKTELDKSFAAAQADPGVRWQEFTIQLRGLALEIGTGVIPAVAGLSNEVRGLASWFNNLSPHTKELIGQWGFLVAVGTLVIGIFSVIAGGVVQLVATLALLGKSFGLLAAEGGFVSVQLAGVIVLITALAFAVAKFPGFRSVIADDIAPIAKFIGVLLALRLGVAALTIVANIATAAMIRLGAASAAAALGQITALLGPIALVTAALIGMQIAVGLLENEMVKSIRYYTIINGKSQEQSKAYEQEARKVGDLAAHYAELIRQRMELASLGPGGEPIAPGGGVTLPKLPIGFPVKGRGGVSPGFGFGDTDKQVNQLERAAQRAARALNVPVTPQFRQLFTEFVKAQNALNKLKREGASTMQMFEAETRLKTAVDNLKSFSKAAVQAAKDLLKYSKQSSDAVILAEGKKVQELEKIAKKKGTMAAWTAYFTALKKLQDDATDIQLQAVQQMFDTTASAAKDTTNKLKDTYDSVLSNLQSQYDTFLGQNKSAFGEMFQGPWLTSALVQDRIEWGQVLNTGDLLKDQRMQVGAFRKWRRDIEKLRKLGLPQSMIDQIAALGPEAGAKQVALIAKMTPKQLAEYKKLWQTGQRLIHEATMKDVNNQLADWQKHGKRIALAIAAGLRSENVALENALKSLIRRMFPAVFKAGNKPAKAAMGMVTPGTGTGDTVHAMLTPGELVLNQKHQRGLKKKLGVSGGPHALFGRIQQFAEGGVVTPFRDLPDSEKRRRIATGFNAGRMSEDQARKAWRFWHLGGGDPTRVPQRPGTTFGQVAPRRRQGNARMFDEALGYGLGVKPSDLRHPIRTIHAMGAAMKASLREASEDKRDPAKILTAGTMLAGMRPRGVTRNRVFYHGSAVKELAILGRQLSLRFANEHGLYGPGIYFTSSRDIASSYARGTRGVMNRQSMHFSGETEADIVKQVKRFLADNPHYEMAFNNTRQVTTTRFHGLPDKETGLHAEPPTTSKHWKGDVEFKRYEPAAPHVRMARLAIKKAFDVEKNNDIPIEDLAAAVKATGVLSVGSFAENWREMETMHLRRNPNMLNDDLYKFMGESFGGADMGHQNVHKILRQLGFDAIKYPGGKMLGGPSHEVYVLIRGSRQIKHPFPKSKPPSTPQSEARRLLDDASAQQAAGKRAFASGGIYKIGGRAGVHAGVRERIPAVYYNDALFVGNVGEIHGTLVHRILEKFNLPGLETGSLLNKPGVRSKSRLLMENSKQIEYWPQNVQYGHDIPARWNLPADMQATASVIKLLQRYIDAPVHDEYGKVFKAGFEHFMRGGVVGDAVRMAKGGIITRPTNIIAGEKGREAIIPLDKTGLGSQTPTVKEQHVPGETVHYHITSTASEADIRKQLKDANWYHRVMK